MLEYTLVMLLICLIIIIFDNHRIIRNLRGKEERLEVENKIIEMLVKEILNK